MNKKAASVLMMIFEMIIVIFIISTSLTIAQRYASSDTTNKINLANDIGMMVETLIGTPGDSIVEYPGNVSKYVFILNSNSVKVFVKGESDQKKVIRNFFLPQPYDAFGTLEEESKLCMEKKGKKVILRKCRGIEEDL